MQNLFTNPIKAKYINKKATAYIYQNGEININGIKYLGYSLTEAIKRYRQQTKKSK